MIEFIFDCPADPFMKKSVTHLLYRINWPIIIIANRYDEIQSPFTKIRHTRLLRARTPSRSRPLLRLGSGLTRLFNLKFVTGPDQSLRELQVDDPVRLELEVTRCASHREPKDSTLIVDGASDPGPAHWHMFNGNAAAASQNNRDSCLSPGRGRRGGGPCLPHRRDGRGGR